MEIPSLNRQGRVWNTKPRAREVAVDSQPVERFTLSDSGEAPDLKPTRARRAGVSAEGPGVQRLLAHRVTTQAMPGWAAVALQDGQRDPQQAVKFWQKYNRELELPASVVKERSALATSSAGKFLRVFPPLFYQDVKGPYAAQAQLLERKSPTLVLAGDCHAGNFGTLRQRDGSTVWGINDFDMVGRGPAEYDLERLATSFALLGAEAGGLKKSDTQDLIAEMGRAYLDEVRKPTGKGIGLSAEESEGCVRKLIEKNSEKSQKHLLKKFAEEGPDGYRLQRNDELQELTPSQRKELDSLMQSYDENQGKTPDLSRPLKVLDAVRKLDSGGSTFGLQRFYVLAEGRDELPVIVEVKQELPSAVETPSGRLADASAKKLWAGMTEVGANLNPISATIQGDGTTYYVREREREKGSLTLEELEGKDWSTLARQSGVALARAHCGQAGARSELLKWVGDGDEQLIEKLQTFASQYAQQTESDRFALEKSLSR